MTIWKLTCPSGNVIYITFEISTNKKVWRISKIKMNHPLFDNDETRNLSNMIQSIIDQSNKPSIDLDFKFEVVSR